MEKNKKNGSLKQSIRKVNCFTVDSKGSILPYINVKPYADMITGGMVYRPQGVLGEKTHFFGPLFAKQNIKNYIEFPDESLKLYCYQTNMMGAFVLFDLSEGRPTPEVMVSPSPTPALFDVLREKESFASKYEVWFLYHQTGVIQGNDLIFYNPEEEPFLFRVGIEL